MRRFALIFLFLIVQIHLFSQNIPEERLVDWSVAGLIDAISEPSTVLNVTNYGLLGDSLSDNSAAFQAVLSTLGSSAAVLYFPEGKYSFQTSLQIPSGVILRGEGSDKTKLFFNLGGSSSHCIVVSASQSEDFISVFSGFEKGSDTLILKSDLGFNDDEFAEIHQENGAWDSNPISWAKKVVGQILKIKHQNEDTLFLINPLRLDYDTALNLEVQKIIPITNVSIECLYIERIDEPISAGSNIYFNYAANCKIRGVESNVSSGAHFYVQASTNILIEGSYIHHAVHYDGAGTNGYGVMLDNHSGECLIQNNIFWFLRHAMMVKTAANGNVFAYNYSSEPNRTEPFSTLSGDISLHGHYAFANLFEGNVVQNIILDHYWGPSGPYNTFFRNRAELYGIIFTNDGLLETDKQNVLGNELTNLVYPFGQYLLFGANHFEYGNNVKGTSIPISTEDIGVDSYFLTTVPDFWDVDLNWPSIGYPNTLDQYKIPAQIRFENASGFTICPLANNFNRSMNSGWSWFSVYLMSQDMSPDNILASLNPQDGDYIKDRKGIGHSAQFYDISGTFTGWAGTLVEIDPQETYKIKLAVEGRLTYEGVPIDYSKEEILVNAGWNWIGYPIPFEMPIGDYLSTLDNVDNDYIKDQINSSTYFETYGWFGNLDIMEPGNGYVMNVGNSGSIHEPIQGNIKGSNFRIKQAVVIDFPRYQVTPSDFEFSGSTIIEVFVDGINIGDTDNILYAFNQDDVCVGITNGLLFPMTNEYLYNVMMYSNLKEGDEINFKFLDSSNNRWYLFEENLNFKEDMIIANAYHPFELRMAISESIYEDGFSINLYPNPFSESLTYSFNLMESKHIRISIISPTGSIVDLLEDRMFSKGVYTMYWNNASIAQGSYYLRFEMDGFKKTIPIIKLN